jgi:hypothetical protein
MGTERKHTFSGWSIALALGAICESDPQFAADNSVDASRVFEVPSSDPPDPHKVLPLHLVKWPSQR